MLLITSSAGLIAAAVLVLAREELPHLSHLDRFPDRAAAGCACKALSRRIKTLEIRQHVYLEHWREYQAAVGDAKRCRLVWEVLAEAHNDLEIYKNYPGTARRTLRKLRALIGEDAWMTGEMPSINE